MASQTDLGIPLSEAPDLLFDREIWAAFKATDTDISDPLNAVGYQVVLRTGMMIEDNPRVPTIPEVLIASFTQKLVRGEIRATGMHLSSPRPRAIAPELWRDAQIEFLDNRVLCGDYQFTHVMILAGSRSIEAAMTARQMSDWMREQKKAGKVLRKTLIAVAEREFGEQYRVAIFDKTYSEVFKRQIGRPKSGA